MPDYLNYPVQMYVMQLLMGGSIGVDKNTRGLVKDHVQALLKDIRYASLVKDCIDIMGKHKHCPDEYKTSTMLLTCCLMQMIDDEDVNILNKDVDFVAKHLTNWLSHIKQYLSR